MLVCQGPSVLLLDEPTNHLDLDMRESLAEALEDYSGALVLVSHDRDLLSRVCDRFWRVRGGWVEEYDGDLDDYTRELSQARADGGTREGADRSADADEREGGRERRQQAARQRETLKPLRKAAEREETRCTRLQADLYAVEKALADPALYDQADGVQLAALLQRQGRLRSELETAEAAWMEALEALENARAEA
jgi:ATP-binding cassette subfamily F protein 3